MKPCFCPNCGGRIVPSDGWGTYRCPDCDAVIRFIGDTVQVDIAHTQTIHHTDEAALEREKRYLQTEKNRQWEKQKAKVKKTSSCFLSIVMFLIAMVLVIVSVAAMIGLPMWALIQER